MYGREIKIKLDIVDKLLSNSLEDTISSFQQISKLDSVSTSYLNLALAAFYNIKQLEVKKYVNLILSPIIDISTLPKNVQAFKHNKLNRSGFFNPKNDLPDFFDFNYYNI